MRPALFYFANPLSSSPTLECCQPVKNKTCHEYFDFAQHKFSRIFTNSVAFFVLIRVIRGEKVQQHLSGALSTVAMGSKQHHH